MPPIIPEGIARLIGQEVLETADEARRWVHAPNAPNEVAYYIGAADELARFVAGAPSLIAKLQRLIDKAPPSRAMASENEELLQAQKLVALVNQMRQYSARGLVHLTRIKLPQYLGKYVYIARKKDRPL